MNVASQKTLFLDFFLKNRLMKLMNFFTISSFIFFLSSPFFGKTHAIYSVGECLMKTMKDKNLIGIQMFEVIQNECEQKMYVTKTDIIEHKGKLLSRYLERREIVGLDQNKDRIHMILPFTNTLPPEF